jgi:hypothetical protein
MVRWASFRCERSAWSAWSWRNTRPIGQLRELETPLLGTRHLRLGRAHAFVPPISPFWSVASHRHRESTKTPRPRPRRPRPANRFFIWSVFGTSAVLSPRFCQPLACFVAAPRGPIRGEWRKGFPIPTVWGHLWSVFMPQSAGGGGVPWSNLEDFHFRERYPCLSPGGDSGANLAKISPCPGPWSLKYHSAFDQVLDRAKACRRRLLATFCHLRGAAAPKTGAP